MGTPKEKGGRFLVGRAPNELKEMAMKIEAIPGPGEANRKKKIKRKEKERKGK